MRDERKGVAAVRAIAKPDPKEHPAYASVYIDRLPDDARLLEHLAENLHATRRLVLSLPEVVDDERIYATKLITSASSRPATLGLWDDLLTFAFRSPMLPGVSRAAEPDRP